MIGFHRGICFPVFVDPDFRCVHEDLVVTAELGERRWSDSKSEGRHNGAVWEIPSTHAFIVAGCTTDSKCRPDNNQHKLSIITQPIYLDMVRVYGVDNPCDVDNEDQTYSLKYGIEFAESVTESESNEAFQELSVKVTKGIKNVASAEFTATFGTKSVETFTTTLTQVSTSIRSVEVNMKLPPKKRVELWQVKEIIHGGRGRILLASTTYEIRYMEISKNGAACTKF